MLQYKRKAVMVEAIKLPHYVRIHFGYQESNPFICGEAGDYLVSADGTLYIAKPDGFTETHERVEASA